MSKKGEIDARAFMERAVTVMRESVAEQRTDGKVCPKVGAVLVKRDGTVEVAHRGELRDGDHAEFTLLERKNRSTALDGSVLFATLEPCAPNSRSHPKLSCAERIVLARIKEVWVGIEDPDPTVDRKGIKHLQDSGVVVHMFDRDLQEIIRQENKEFIAQAEERAGAAREEGSKEVSLSSLEERLGDVDDSDLSREALERYRSTARIEPAIGSDAFNRLLIRQGLLKENGRLAPTGFGLLLFGTRPRDAMPQAGLLATIRYPDGGEEIETFDGPMVLVPEQVEKWLKGKLPNVVTRAEMQRRTVPALPFELVREGVVNALIHRDYAIEQAKAHLIVTSDTISILSPGRPVPPITLDQMRSFNAPMLSRNPALHYVFARMELAEERGLGLRSLRARAAELRLPLPKYSWDDPYLMLTLYRHPEAIQADIPETVASGLKEDERSALNFIAARESATARDVREGLDVDERKAQRLLKKLVDAGLVRAVGEGRARRYESVRS